MPYRSRVRALLVALFVLGIVVPTMAIDGGAIVAKAGDVVGLAGTPGLAAEPSPSPTMTQAPSEAFFDDFEDPGSGWFKGESDSSGRGIWSYEAGRYKIDICGESFRSSSRRRWMAGEGAYEVDMYLDDSPTTAGAIIFAVSSDWQQYYAFELRANGYYSLWRVNEGEWEDLVLWTPHAAINPGTAMNHLKAEWRYGQIDLYVNGVHLGTVYDGTHSQKAYLGVRGITFEGAPETTTIYWDNFSYWPRGVPTPTPTLTPTITPTPVSRCRLPLILDR